MRRTLQIALVVALALASCTSGESAGTSVGGVDPIPEPQVRGIDVSDFFLGTCAACHGSDRGGISGPALRPSDLVEDDAFYQDVIRNGRPELGMPAWGGLGLTDEDITTLVEFLRKEPVDAPVVASGENVLDGAGPIDLGAIERGASKPFVLELENPTTSTVELIRFSSPSFSLFLLDALPVVIDPGGSVALDAVFVQPPTTEVGSDTAGNATLDMAVAGRATSQVVQVSATVAEPARTLAYSTVGLPSQPARLAAWDRYVYVGYFNGLIDVFEFTDLDELTRVEQIEVVAATPNHGPDGSPNPDAYGRLIGGLAVGADGTLYVTHSDPRLNEGEFARTGHLADLNSGMVTALEGPPGSYGADGHRHDLIVGLPRNVTNHVPLGLVVDADRLFVVVGAMTDSGVPDPSKPDPETELSGSILRLDLATDRVDLPVVLAGPGSAPGGLDDLVPGVLDIWATGVRNGFGLTMHDGNLYLTDQGSDGGGVPSPADGIPGFGPFFGSDHLHRVPQGAFLGQPNTTRGEPILNDGSAYETPVTNPDFVSPLYKFGVHNSATGITFYEHTLLPELTGKLLVARFSVTVGLHVLTIEDGRVTNVEVVAGPSDIGNLTDVVVGPDGQVVMSAFWDLQLLVATGWE